MQAYCTLLEVCKPWAADRGREEPTMALYVLQRPQSQFWGVFFLKRKWGNVLFTVNRNLPFPEVKSQGNYYSIPQHTDGLSSSPPPPRIVYTMIVFI